MHMNTSTHRPIKEHTNAFHGLGGRGNVMAEAGIGNKRQAAKNLVKALVLESSDFT